MGKYLNLRRAVALGLIFAFFLNSLGPLPEAQAQDFALPAPGVMVPLSPAFNPPILKGIKVHPDNPFRFDFILDRGDSQESSQALKDESGKLIKYFLASLTIPEKDLWVNLSPYEKNRIVPESFGQTEMGRDLLAEDYMLKQITASLIYPEGETGKRFWKRIYEEAAQRFGTTNIPVNTFNKVWIVPQKAVVYENAKAGTAYVVESRLKVMLEQDYLALSHHVIPAPTESWGQAKAGPLTGHSQELGIQNTSALGSNIIREIVIPELTKEVNEDRNFSQLRQVYNSLILATWYKKKIKDSILEQVYADKNKVAGVNIDDPQEKEKIYERYLQAFKKGVYNYIKEDVDPATQETVPRKYFSGGLNIDPAMVMSMANNLGNTGPLSNLMEVDSGMNLAMTGVGRTADGAMMHTPINKMIERYKQELVKFYQEAGYNLDDLEKARIDLLNYTLMVQPDPKRIKMFFERSLSDTTLTEDALREEGQSIDRTVGKFLRAKYQKGLKEQADNLSGIRDFFIYEQIIQHNVPVSEFEKEYAWLPYKERWIEDRLVGESIRKLLHESFSTMIAEKVLKGADSLGSLDELRDFINYIDSWHEFISLKGAKIEFTSQYTDQFELYLRIAQWLNTFYSELEISVDHGSKAVILTVKDTIEDEELKNIYSREAFHELNEVFEQVRLNYLQDIGIRLTVRKLGLLVNGELNLRFVMALRSLLNKDIEPQNSDLMNELLLFYDAWLHSGLNFREGEGGNDMKLILGDKTWEVNFLSLKRFVIEVLAQAILFDVIGGNNSYQNQRFRLLYSVSELIQYRNVDFDRSKQSAEHQELSRTYLKDLLDGLNSEVQKIIGSDPKEKVRRILTLIGFSDEEIRDAAMTAEGEAEAIAKRVLPLDPSRPNVQSFDFTSDILRILDTARELEGSGEKVTIRFQAGPTGKVAVLNKPVSYAIDWIKGNPQGFVLVIAAGREDYPKDIFIYVPATKDAAMGVGNSDFAMAASDIEKQIAEKREALEKAKGVAKRWFVRAGSHSNNSQRDEALKKMGEVRQLIRRLQQEIADLVYAQRKARLGIFGFADAAMTGVGGAAGPAKDEAMASKAEQSNSPNVSLRFSEKDLLNIGLVGRFVDHRRPGSSRRLNLNGIFPGIDDAPKAVRDLLTERLLSPPAGADRIRLFQKDVRQIMHLFSDGPKDEVIKKLEELSRLVSNFDNEFSGGGLIPRVRGHGFNREMRVLYLKGYGQWQHLEDFPTVTGVLVHMGKMIIILQEIYDFLPESPSGLTRKWKEDLRSLLARKEIQPFLEHKEFLSLAGKVSRVLGYPDFNYDWEDGDRQKMPEALVNLIKNKEFQGLAEQYQDIWKTKENKYSFLRQFPDGIMRSDLAKMDYYVRIALLILNDGWQFPDVQEQLGVVHLHHYSNPLLSKRSSDEPIVPIYIDLGEGQTAILLSGPNMGGKTTTARSIGLAVLLTHMGMPIPAESPRMGLFKNIYTIFPGSEQLRDGYGYFASMVEDLTQLIRKAGPGDLVILDEVPTGTDYKELTAVTVVLLEDMIRTGATVVVTGHLKEAFRRLVQRTGQQALMHTVIEDNGQMRPDFHLQPGVAGSSYAIELMKKAGFPQQLQDLAREYYGKIMGLDGIRAKIAKEDALQLRFDSISASQEWNSSLIKTAVNQMYPSEYFAFTETKVDLMMKIDEMIKKEIPSIEEVDNRLAITGNFLGQGEGHLKGLTEHLSAFEKIDTGRRSLFNFDDKDDLTMSGEKLARLERFLAALSAYVGIFDRYPWGKNVVQDLKSLQERAEAIKNKYLVNVAGEADAKQRLLNFQIEWRLLNKDVKKIASFLDYYGGISRSIIKLRLKKPEFVNEQHVFQLDRSVPFFILKGSVKPQSFKITPDRPVAVLTGPNSSGKTVLMFNVYMNELLALYGFYVPGQLRTSRFDKVLGFFGGYDRIGQRESYFLNVLRQYSQILAAATPNSFVVLDELHGTDNFELAAIQLAVLHYLRSLGATVIFNTHIRDGLKMLDQKIGLDFWKTDVVYDAKENNVRPLFSLSRDPNLEAQSYGLTVTRNLLTDDQYRRALAIKDELSAGQDSAMVGKMPGGIDLTSDKALTVQNNGQGIKFHLDPAQLAQLQNAPGFVPVIISIQPLKSLSGFLGLNQTTKA